MLAFLSEKHAASSSKAAASMMAGKAVQVFHREHSASGSRAQYNTVLALCTTLPVLPHAPVHSMKPDPEPSLEPGQLWPYLSTGVM